MLIPAAGKRWCRLVWRPLGNRKVMAFAASFVAVSLLAAGGAAAGTVRPNAGPVHPHPAPAARLGILPTALAGFGRDRLDWASFGLARFDRAELDRAGWAALARLGDRAQAGRASGSVVLGGSPGAPAANPRTDTLYVPIQCRTSFCPSQNGHVVDVINAANCNAKIRSDCKVVARARVGSSPLAAVVDEKTDTVYVMNGNDGTVSVLNGARCNARVTSGCGRTVATIKVGKAPVAGAVNPATRTLYVATPGSGTVSVANVAACNAHTTRGCGRPVRTVKDTAGPIGIGIDVATDTVYAANAQPSGPGGTVSVIDGATCNGHTGRGCRKVPATVRVGTNPSAVSVDQASDTIYVSNSDNGPAGSVSVINGARCNARTTAGCHRTPPAVPTGIGTSMVAVDQALHTVFAINTGDDTLSAINTRTCGAAVTFDCHRRPPNQKAAPDHGPRYNPFPNAFALIPRTGTAYIMNIGGGNIVTVTSISHCNATNTSGCRTEATAVPAPGDGFLVSADPATDTIYAANTSLPQIDVLNGATCRAGHLADCTPVAKIPVGNPFANLGAIDHGTHTLYASDTLSDTVSVINTAACNAEDTSGCGKPSPTVKVGPGPGPPALNPVTRTLYVPFGINASLVGVVNAAICNATDTSGCGQAPAVVKVGQCTFTLAVSAATDTVYSPSAGTVASSCTDGDTISVINGATCNGADHSGCGHLAATAKVGRRPFGVAVDDRTHAVYVINNANGDRPGTVSVINSATCNGTDTVGCVRRFLTVTVGRSPVFIAVDTRTGFVYVADFASAAVSVFNGSQCNAEVAAGCRTAAGEQAVGSGPQGIALNQRTHSVYVAEAYRPGFMSVFRTARR